MQQAIGRQFQLPVATFVPQCEVKGALSQRPLMQLDAAGASRVASSEFESSRAEPGRTAGRIGSAS